MARSRKSVNIISFSSEEGIGVISFQLPYLKSALLMTAKESG